MYTLPVVYELFLHYGITTFTQVQHLNGERCSVESSAFHPAVCWFIVMIYSVYSFVLPAVHKCQKQTTCAEVRMNNIQYIGVPENVTMLKTYIPIYSVSMLL